MESKLDATTIRNTVINTLTNVRNQQEQAAIDIASVQDHLDVLSYKLKSIRVAINIAESAFEKAVIQADEMLETFGKEPCVSTVVRSKAVPTSPPPGLDRAAPLPVPEQEQTATEREGEEPI